MADNVPITGSGSATAASDQVTYSGDAGVHVQLVRLIGVTGSEGSKTTVELMRAEDAAASDGDLGVPMLAVREYAGPGTDGDYGNLSIRSNGDLKVVVYRDQVRKSVQSGGLTTATTSYSSGDQVGTMFSLTGMARANGGGGMITGVQIVSAADIIGAMDVFFFRTNATLAADNAAFAISDADALELVALVQLSGAWDIGNNRIVQQYSMAVPYECGSSTTTLYAALVTRFSHTFFGATTDLQLIVHAERYS